LTVWNYVRKWTVMTTRRKNTNKRFDKVTNIYSAMHFPYNIT